MTDTTRADAITSSATWSRVRALVEEALTLTPDERTAFLSMSCGDDVALRRQVERLTLACERAGDTWGFLARPAGELAAPLLAEMADVHTRLSEALGGRYRIDREIGAGGMATVYLAYDVRHGRHVAIKVLHPELSSVLGAERFLSEIKTTAALQHPHILPLFDSGSADGLLFYVMPLVEGETLRARLAREPQLAVAEVVSIASEVANALAYAHRRGVIHRDIKPENILLHEGRPVVADFGIALAVQSAGSQRTTLPGISLGTPRYMSPEQARGAIDISARSDIYSLGAVTYEMLTGAPPFAGAADRDVAPEAISVSREHVTPNVEAAVFSALEMVPADRFESADEFARALSDPGFRGTGPAGARARAERSLGRRYQILLAVLGALAMSLAGLAAWGWSRSAPADVVRFSMVLPHEFGIVSKAAMGATIAVSPDGKVVIFTGSANDGTRRLYVRALDEATPHALPGTDGGSQPFYSPDGQWIGFWSGGWLRKVAVEGGPPQTVTETPEVVGATWTSRDVIVYSYAGRLLAVPAAGGSPSVLYAPDSTKGETYLFYPTALSDGDHVLYSSYRSADLESVTIGLASVSARSGKSLDIPGTNALGVIDGRLIYATRDDKLMAVPIDVSAGRTTAAATAVASGVSVTPVGAAKVALSLSGTLAYLSGGRESRIVLTDGREPAQVVLSDRRAYAYPRFSPDGHRIAMSIDAEGRSDVWVYDVGSRTLTRLSSGGSSNERPEWTPDGSRVLYRTDAGARSSIWWRTADLSGPELPLLAGEHANYFEAVMTPDGRSVVFQVDTSGSPDIATLALVGDTSLKSISMSRYTETQPRVSPDGRWVAFVTAESGSDQVVVQPITGPGARVQVSPNGGIEPVWSRDGRRLFYRVNKQFMVANVSASPAFTVVSHEVLFADTFVPAVSPHANYDVSPDGTRLLVLDPVEDAQLLVVRNWSTEVRARLRDRAAQP